MNTLCDAIVEKEWRPKKLLKDKLTTLHDIVLYIARHAPLLLASHARAEAPPKPEFTMDAGWSTGDIVFLSFLSEAHVQHQDSLRNLGKSPFCV